MTLRNGEMYYYYNALSGKVTILLTIISGFISGKGLEIFFRTLHNWSGAYGNVGFSLADIVLTLLRAIILVCFGYFLLFNKKLHKQLRLQRSVYAILEEMKAELEGMANELKARFGTDGHSLNEDIISIKNKLYLQRMGTKLEEMKNTLEGKKMPKEMVEILDKWEKFLSSELEYLSSELEYLSSELESLIQIDRTRKEIGILFILKSRLEYQILFKLRAARVVAEEA
ncbi:hypothetical protein GINT2_001554 [Glugoides intestinalis]